MPKKIAKVHCEHETDDHGYHGQDTLGEFGARPPHGQFYIVRETGELKNENGNTVAKHPKGVFVDSNSCEYFVPSSNHVPHNPRGWSHVKGKALEEVKTKYGSPRKADYAYALEDWKRAEALNNGEWSYTGICAVAEVHISTDAGATWAVQDLRTPGIWGVESDSGDDYVQEIKEDELSGLACILKEFGFTDAEIYEALVQCDDFPMPVSPEQWTWKCDTAMKLLRAIADDHAFDRLPILADALEDAGVEDEDFLAYLRNPGQHPEVLVKRWLPKWEAKKTA